jgi:hypothetical protein
VGEGSNKASTHVASRRTPGLFLAREPFVVPLARLAFCNQTGLEWFRYKLIFMHCNGVFR